jgi:hypothetical protein
MFNLIYNRIINLSGAIKLSYCLKTIIIVATLFLLINEGSIPSITRTIKITDIKPEIGLAYIAELQSKLLSSHENKINSQLYEVVRVPYDGSVPEYLEWSVLSGYIAQIISKRFQSLKMDSLKSIGTPNSVHDDIRQFGEGRYSIWHGYLYFSTPDGTNPITNGKSYVLTVRYYVPLTIMIILGIASIYFSVSMIWYTSTGLYHKYALARTILPSAITSIALLVIIVLTGELYYRYKIPFTEISWPSKFDKKLGFIFTPGSTIQWTNKTDFWAENKINSLGFPDREPLIPKPEDIFRILFIGDSFVEAAQVTIDKKFHVLLEERVKKESKHIIDTVAFGFSGTGQTNQLSWLENLHSEIDPDLVVLIFVANDFANNSPLLESVRNGWSPEQTPRLFYDLNESGDIIRLDINENWSKHRIPSNDTSQDPATTYAERIKFLSNTEAFRKKLDGWKFPDDFDMDFMFFTESQLPQVFEEALMLTSHTLGEYKKLAENNNWNFMLVATEGTTQNFGELYRTENPHKRVWVNELQWLRIKSIATEHNIPALNLNVKFKSYGDPSDAHFKHDSHWSETGHQWAARAIHEFLMEHPKLLQQ